MKKSDWPLKTTTIGMVLYPDLAQLDLTGPYEVFCQIPNTTVRLIAASHHAVTTEYGMRIVPDTSIRDCPPLSVLFVPGGVGINRLLEDEAFLSFLRTQAEQAEYVTSVCTGALLLGAAGLLKGYRATTHWLSLDMLRLVGAKPVADRVVIDRNRITGAGITSGIDLALLLAAKLAGTRIAQQIQLMMEYAPAPPFHAGSPKTAPADIVMRLVSGR